MDNVRTINLMKNITWNVKKAEILRLDQSRGGVTFEDCVDALEQRRILDNISNPIAKRKNQWMYILEINNYAYAVPYVKSNNEIFLKTVYPSRKYTKIYLQR